MDEDGECDGDGAFVMIQRGERRKRADSGWRGKAESQEGGAILAVGDHEPMRPGFSPEDYPLNRTVLCSCRLPGNPGYLPNQGTYLSAACFCAANS